MAAMFTRNKFMGWYTISGRGICYGDVRLIGCIGLRWCSRYRIGWGRARSRGRARVSRLFLLWLWLVGRSLASGLERRRGDRREKYADFDGSDVACCCMCEWLGEEMGIEVERKGLMLYTDLPSAIYANASCWRSGSYGD